MERTPPVNQRAAGAILPDADKFAHDLTQRYCQVLSTKRMNDLVNSRSTSRQSTPSFDYGSPQPPPRSHARSARSSLRNIPIEPQEPAPQDIQSKRFYNFLHAVSRIPLRWENPGQLDEALKSVPLQRIYDQADEESQILRAEAESMGKKPQWSYHDCVIRNLMKWFKHSFFSWVDNPPCSRCFSPTFPMGLTAPTPEEHAHSANQVESYQCSNETCRAYERFPRFNDAMVLLQWRKGRAGEWNTCFGMLCRALGQRVRYVWNAEDLVWLEVWSKHRKRWIHVDVCENRFDQPRLYAEGWGKKMSYCIAFSADGCTDVTRRYVRHAAKFGLNRNKCPEPVLMYLLNDIRNKLRSNMTKQEKFVLNKEDHREELELRDCMRIATANEICNLRVDEIIQGRYLPRSEPPKVAERAHEIAGRTRAHGNAGQHNPHNPPSR